MKLQKELLDRIENELKQKRQDELVKISKLTAESIVKKFWCDLLRLGEMKNERESNLAQEWLCHSGILSEADWQKVRGYLSDLVNPPIRELKRL